MMAAGIRIPGIFLFARRALIIPPRRTCAVFLGGKFWRAATAALPPQPQLLGVSQELGLRHLPSRRHKTLGM